jgi:hypothetical protein
VTKSQSFECYAHHCFRKGAILFPWWTGIESAGCLLWFISTWSQHQFTIVKEGDLLKYYQSFCVQIVKVNGYTINWRKPTTSVNLFTDIWQVVKRENSVVYVNEYRDSLFGSLLALFKTCLLFVTSGYLHLKKH